MKNYMKKIDEGLIRHFKDYDSIPNLQRTLNWSIFGSEIANFENNSILERAIALHEKLKSSKGDNPLLLKQLRLKDVFEIVRVFRSIRDSCKEKYEFDGKTLGTFQIKFKKHSNEGIQYYVEIKQTCKGKLCKYVNKDFFVPLSDSSDTYDSSDTCESEEELTWAELYRSYFFPHDVSITECGTLTTDSWTP